MKRRKLAITLLLSAAVGLAWVVYSETRTSAQDEPQYVGAEKCAECHPDTVDNWQMTAHRRTLFNDDPSNKGCESCHGAGGAHVDAGGDPELIIRPEKLKPEQTAKICMKCHTQDHVTLWSTSAHAKAKLNCTNCHNSHSPDTAMMVKDIENGKLELEGLTRAIQQAELQANTAKTGSDEQARANEKVEELKDQRNTLLEELKGAETVYKRSAEPYICYNCHKPQQVQGKMPSHHPIEEGKMKCGDCHNPHGGPDGMLKEESVNETCFKCHAEKSGPFVFDHPPVSDDCTTCHKPHGSVNDNLLTQSEPFLCLKCHAGPHSRSNSLANARNFSTYYTECTDCHAAIHGSDEHAPLHY